MNNGAALNATTINGWRGDTTVRIQVISYAIAQGVMKGRALRRSPVVGEVRAIGGEGRCWRRSPVVGVAQATATITARVLHLVSMPMVCVARATATITAVAKPITPVRAPIVGRASASLTGSGGRRWSRLILTGNAQATATITARALRRSPLVGVAQAQGVIESTIYRRIPWDEPAPEGRVFIVHAGTHFFYVVS